MWPRVDGLRSCELGFPGSSGEVGRIEVTEVVVRRFGDVPWEFADGEGEGFTSIEHWREAHRRHWAREGREITPDTQVVCLRFDLV